MPLIYVVAGEASGDVLGGRLMAALRRRGRTWSSPASAAPAWQAQGLHSLFPMHDLAVMGLVEILPRLRTLRSRMLSVVATSRRSGRMWW